MARAMTGVLAALFMTALLPALAGAATVRVDEPNSARATLVFEAAAAEQNAVTTTLVSQDPDGNRYSVRDTGASLTPGTGCSGGGTPGTAAICLVPRSRPGMFPSDFGRSVVLSFALGDDNNSLDTTAVPAVDGGGGEFRLEMTAGGGADVLQTGPGRDQIDPGAGSDSVIAGGGDDTVLATATADGADNYDLGPGMDALSYALRTAGVTVDLTDPTHAGAAGENDSLLRVETVAGGQAADRLSGTDAESGTLGVAEAFYGGGGEDVLIGRGGPDLLTSAPYNFGPTLVPVDDADVVLRGGPGADGLSSHGGDDVASGGGGADNIDVGSGDDRGRGGGGPDTIFGREGGDQLKGGRDRDRIDAGFAGITPPDGAVDTVNCGPSRRDKALSIEPHDHVRKCEKVKPA